MSSGRRWSPDRFLPFSVPSSYRYMAARGKPVYKFGPFRIAGAEGLLTRNGRSIRLTPKSFELLLFLVENRGRLLDKETLLTNVWPGTFVEESNLTKNVFLLRR